MIIRDGTPNKRRSLFLLGLLSRQVQVFVLISNIGFTLRYPSNDDLENS